MQKSRMQATHLVFFHFTFNQALEEIDQIDLQIALAGG
jgi:hypothetical protein